MAEKKKLVRRVVGRSQEMLSCLLTTEELADRAQQLAAKVGEAGNHAAHSEQVKAGLKAEEKRIESEIHRLGKIVTRKEEPRVIDVEVVDDYEDGLHLEIRQDTGEVVRSRGRSEHERQLSIVEKKNGTAEATAP